MSTSVQFLNIASLIPLAQADLHADDPFGVSTTRAKAGSAGYYVDAFGFRQFRYVRNQQGSAVTVGTVMRKALDSTAATCTVPTPTSCSIAANTSAVANAWVGRILIDETAAAAGAAPEGESAIIIASNTTTQIGLDPRLPFSTAMATGDLLRIKTPGWHVITATTSVFAALTAGVVVGRDGISNGNHGWVQNHGYCPIVSLDTALVTVGMAAYNGVQAGKVIGFATTARHLMLGRFAASAGATNSGFTPVDLTLGAGGGVIVDDEA